MKGDNDDSGLLADDDPLLSFDTLLDDEEDDMPSGRDEPEDELEEAEDHGN